MSWLNYVGRAVRVSGMACFLVILTCRGATAVQLGLIDCYPDGTRPVKCGSSIKLETAYNQESKELLITITGPQGIASRIYNNSSFYGPDEKQKRKAMTIYYAHLQKDKNVSWEEGYMMAGYTKENSAAPKNPEEYLTFKYYYDNRRLYYGQPYLKQDLSFPFWAANKSYICWIYNFRLIKHDYNAGNIECTPNQ